MTQTNYSTKHIKNKHLTIKERAQIELLIKQGSKKSEIARIIGISRSTLYNELNRGTVEQMDTCFSFSSMTSLARSSGDMEWTFYSQKFDNKN